MLSFDNTGQKLWNDAANWWHLDYHLREIAKDIDEIYHSHGAHLTVTSLWRPDSAVHAAYRAIDIRVRDLLESVRQPVADRINALYPRSDGFMTCVYGDEKHLDHFHIQVPPHRDPVKKRILR